MSFPSAKTRCRQVSPAIQAITLASMAEKSATMNFFPSGATKAVRMSWESVSGISSYSSLTASRFPVRTSARAWDRSER